MNHFTGACTRKNNQGWFAGNGLYLPSLGCLARPFFGNIFLYREEQATHEYSAVPVAVIMGCLITAPPAPNAPGTAPIESATSGAESPADAAIFPPAQKRDRGNLIKEIGQPASVTNAAQQLILEFVVTKIDRKPKCDAEYATKPENG